MVASVALGLLLSLLPLASANASAQAWTLVQTIDLSQLNPPSPDPAGVTYMPGPDRLLVSDVDVDELPIFQGVNLYQMTRTGSLTATGVTTAFSNEPAGTGFNPANGTLFLSDDNKDRVFIDLPGADGRYGTSDDQVTSFSTAAFGSGDPEGVDYDTSSGHLFVADGAGREVYEVSPGTNGTFDGVPASGGDDVVTHFDLAQFGVVDGEGIGHDASRDTLVIADRGSRRIFEVTKSGQLLQIIDISTIPGIRNPAGITLAPASDNSGRMNYWIVDRGRDNSADPTENDGKLYELSVAASDRPPSVSITAPADGATLAGTVAIEASVSDDGGVTQVQFFVDGTSMGTDTTAPYSTTWDTTTVTDGPHTIVATATDTIGQAGSDSISVTVDNADSPPTATVTTPADGSAVSGTITITASASDDRGINQVEFFVDGTSIGADTTAPYSTPWDTTTAADGAHTITATATDTSGQTGSHSVSVTVDNTPPTVAITSPSAGDTVSETITVQASASDTGTSVASVQFFVDGTSIGTDTNGADGWSISWNTRTVANGSHDLRADARDAAGNTATSALVSVTVNNSALSTLDVPIAAGADDVEQRPTGGMRLANADLELVTDGAEVQTVGLRFTGISVPAGATILNAYVQFRADEKSSVATNLTVGGEASDNAPPFTNQKFNVSSRLDTTASVAWTPPAWNLVGEAGPAQRTPNLSAVLQEIVGRSGWGSGNALVLVITGSGKRVAEPFEGGFPPVLHIEYTTG